MKLRERQETGEHTNVDTKPENLRPKGKKDLKQKKMEWQSKQELKVNKQRRVKGEKTRNGVIELWWLSVEIFTVKKSQA